MSGSASPVLVCFALKEEAFPFRRWARQHPEIHVLLTGIGAKNAARSLQSALTQGSPTAVWTCGFAGGLNPALVHSTVVFSAEHDWPWHEPLQRAGARVAQFHSASRIASSAAEKQQLWESTGADAVEMESAVIRQHCRAAGIPSATVRVISDTAHEDLPLDFNRLLTADDQLSLRRLALAILKSPHRIPRLLQLHRQSRLAAQRLAQVLMAVLG